MNDLQNINYDKLSKIFSKYFSLCYVSKDISDKFACISLTCYLTNELKKKGKNVTCYQVLLALCKEYDDFTKNTFLKSLGAICEDFMFGCEVFPTFDLKPKDIPKTLKNILDNSTPF